MEKMEEEIWNLIQKCHLESLLWKVIGHFDNSNSVIEILYRKEEQKYEIRKMWCKRLATIFVIFIGIIFIFILGSLPSEKQSIIENKNIISREDEGKEITFEIIAKMNGKTKSETMTLNLEDREFTEEELKKLDKMCLSYLKEKLRGDNASYEAVSSPLNLVAAIPETGIELAWMIPEEYMNQDGSLKMLDIPEKGVKTTLAVEAKWRNWEKEYSFPIIIDVEKLPKEERTFNQIKEVVEKKVTEQGKQKEIALPTTVGGYDVQYQDVEEEKHSYVYVLLLVFIFLLPLFWKKEEKKSLEEREKQLQFDYPEFINKTMLLLNAGLNIRGCFERLGEEYQYNLKKGGERRYVYEEVLTTYQEMCNGASEAASIEHFGKRCRQLCYLRYASIINQNMKKGTEGFIALLEAEATDAFEKRKELSRQLGETAGTKLLLPMMLMFGIIIAIIIVPAFMSM